MERWGGGLLHTFNVLLVELLKLATIILSFCSDTHTRAPTPTRVFSGGFLRRLTDAGVPINLLACQITTSNKIRRHFRDAVQHCLLIPPSPIFNDFYHTSGLSCTCTAARATSGLLASPELRRARGLASQEGKRGVGGDVGGRKRRAASQSLLRRLLQRQHACTLLSDTLITRIMAGAREYKTPRGCSPRCRASPPLVFSLGD